MCEPNAIEFDCVDCGVHVVAYGRVHANDQCVCLTCCWLRDHPDVPDHVRKLLLRIDPNDPDRL